MNQMTLPSTPRELERMRSEAKHATSQSRRRLAILYIYKWPGKKPFVSLIPGYRSGGLAPEPRYDRR